MESVSLGMEVQKALLQPVIVKKLEYVFQMDNMEEMKWTGGGECVGSKWELKKELTKKKKKEFEREKKGVSCSRE